MNKYKVIALIGKAGSGKDTVMKKMLEILPFQLNEIVSCTTRPPRDYEVDGINYHFYTKEKYKSKVLNGEMLETSQFNNWFYGTPISSLNIAKINIGVFNPQGIDSLMKRNDIELKVFYIRANDKERLLRQLNREESPNVHEIIRRFHTDHEDFESIVERFPMKFIKNDASYV